MKDLKVRLINMLLLKHQSKIKSDQVELIVSDIIQVIKEHYCE